MIIADGRDGSTLIDPETLTDKQLLRWMRTGNQQAAAIYLRRHPEARKAPAK